MPVQTPALAASFRSTALRAMPQKVDRAARVLLGYAVISRGEALGHGLWIDEALLDQVVEAGNAAGGKGVKSRFTHPGLCADGLGTYLGRTRNFRREGSRVLGDLTLAEVASKSPQGDLAGYVLDLAEEDADCFGASIVFELDIGAMEFFGAQHRDQKGNFKSPDPDNVDNYPHARLARLRASDVVDEPAANPNGFFSDRDELASRGESALRFVFGLDAQAAPELFGGLAPVRARAFVQGFMDRHGLKVVPLERKSAMPEPVPAPAPVPPAAPVAATLPELEALAQGRPAFVVEQLKKSATLAAATLALKDLELAEEKARAEKLAKENEELRKPRAEGAAPVKFDAAGGEPEPERDFIELARDYAREHKCPMKDALSACARKYPRAYAKNDPNFTAKQAQKNAAKEEQARKERLAAGR